MGDERCQKPRCVEMKSRVRRAEFEVKSSGRAYDELKKSFDAMVASAAAGEVRRVSAELVVSERLVSELTVELSRSKAQRNFSRAREAECVDLLADKKVLARRIRLLESDALAVAKKRAVLERTLLTGHASEVGALRDGMSAMASEGVRAARLCVSRGAA